MSYYKISFEGLKEKNGTIAVPLLVNKLQTFQSLNYVVGEYGEKRPFKAASMGAKKKSIIGDYTLIFSGIKEGSTVLEVASGGFQSSLDCERDGKYVPKSSKTLGLVHRYVGLLGDENRSDELQEEIGDSGYYKKILTLLYEFAPKETDTYKIRLEDEKQYSHYITKDTRIKLKSMVEIDYVDEKDRIYCPVLKVSAEVEKDGTRSFETSIDGKRIKVPIDSAKLPLMSENLGYIVEIECEYSLDDEEQIVKIFNVTSIEKKEEISLYELDYLEERYDLVKPLMVRIEGNISEEQGYWILENDDLGIYVAEKDWGDAYDSFCGSFDFLVKEYVETQDKLSPRAKLLGDKIRGYLGRC